MPDDGVRQGILEAVEAGFDDRANLDSTLTVTKTLALFIAEWCGLEPVSGHER